MAGMMRKNRDKLRYEYFCDLSPTLLESEYRKVADEAYSRVWEIYTSTDGWKAIPGGNLNAGLVEWKRFVDQGKVFKLQAKVNGTQTDIFNALNRFFESQSELNPYMVESKCIMKVDEDIKITYAAMKSIGPLSARDFLVLYQWREQGELTFVTYVSTEHPAYPHGKNHIRAWQDPGAWVIKPIQGEPNSCMVTCLSNIDFKGWMPKVFVEHGHPEMLLNNLKLLKKYADSAQNHLRF